MFARIERLKSEWTDRYVVVDAAVPELARFAAATGVVKTVNMNGRCLVEFDQFNNIGWYDIDPSCLKVVPKPEPKPAEAKAAKPAAAKPAAAKPAAEKPAAEKPAAGPAAKPGAKPAGARPSTADILAAARAKGAGAAPAASAPAKAAPPKAPAPAGGAAPPGGKLSTAEILARARAAKGAGESPAPAAAKTEPVGDAVDTEPTAVEPPAVVAKPAKASAAKGPLPTTTAEKIAWCRAHDAK